VDVVTKIIASVGIMGKIIGDTSTVHPDTSAESYLKLLEAGALFVAG
jgi:hypothetical protein